MKSKPLIQVFVALILMVGLVGGSQPALASSESSPLLDAMIVDRSLSFWDATYFGFVNSGVFENWHFDFTESHTFTVSASPVTSLGELVPLLILQDSSGNEITRGTNTITSTQAAGSYPIQVQPESGGGIYMLTLREV